MLVVLLILFTQVLAYSEEDKYVDLLSDTEKQQFIEKVARRILKDVQSQEYETNVKSGEMTDEQLNKHSEYVKAILKQETDYMRRSKGEIVKDKEGKLQSEEKETFGVKPLESEKLATVDDPDFEELDLTLRSNRKDIANPNESTTDYIKVEMITDNVSIIKRSVQDNNLNKSFDSVETTPETLDRILQTKTTISNQVEAITEKTKVETVLKKSENVESTTTGVVTSKTELTVVSNSSEEPILAEFTTIASKLIEPKNDSLLKVVPMAKTELKSHDSIEETKDKYLDITRFITELNKNDEIELVKGKHSGSGESDSEGVQTRGIEEPWSRKSIRRQINEGSKSVEEITESDTTTSAVEYFGFKSKENKLDEYNNVSSVDEELTTLSYTFESTSINDTTIESTTSVITAIDSTTKVSTTDSPTTENPTTESKTITTNKDDIIEPYKKSRNDTSKGTKTELDAITEMTTESTLTSTLTDEGTTEFVPEATTSTEILTKTTTNTTESTVMPIATTEETKIIVEQFTSASTPAITVESFTIKPTESSTKKKVSKKEWPNIELRSFESQEVTTKTQGSDKATNKLPTEATTKKIEHKVILHKLEKNIVGPKAYGIAAAKKEKKDKNFIELQKVYYDNNYRVKHGKEYHVYEISADKTPFITEEVSMVDQPYYVPIYNYSPNNAYFNPQNRLGPNPGDSRVEKIGAFTLDGNDIEPQDENKEIMNFDMVYSDTAVDNMRKKFGNKQILSYSIHKQHNQQDKRRGEVNTDDYLDSDYYSGKFRKDLERRVNQEETHYAFPNSDENDHPAHSIQEGNLKDHVRAVRNILFHQKSFGLLDKDKYGREITKLRAQHKKKPSEVKPKNTHKLRSAPNNDSITNGNKKTKHNNNRNSEKNIVIDYYLGSVQPAIRADKNIGNGRKHIQKVGYLKNQNDTKELYVIDEFFKQNVEKYIQEQKAKSLNRPKNDLRPATPHPVAKTKQLAENRHKEIEQEKQRIEEIMKKSKINYAYKHDEKKKEVPIESIPQIILLAELFRNINGTVKNEETTDATENIPVNSNDNTSGPPVKEELNLKLNHSRNDVVKVGVYLKVLSDMISLDNNALKQYDWLGTTVDIQSALQKLFELTSLVINEEDIHPSDMEILKYVVFLHKLACEIIEANNFGAQLRKKLFLPRNKKKKLKPHILKERGLINRVWLYLRQEVREVDENGDLKNLNKFLMDIEDCLYELNDAIKNIAKITKYKNQHWYQNLKDLYLNTDEKNLLELLLHMTVLRLFALIEESAKNGLEYDYVQYMKNNRKDAKKTLEEMIFVIQILEEYNRFVE